MVNRERTAIRYNSNGRRVKLCTMLRRQRVILKTNNHGLTNGNISHIRYLTVKR